MGRRGAIASSRLSGPERAARGTRRNGAARTGPVEPLDSELAPVVATMREFLDRTEALRVVLLLDRGDAEPVIIDLDAGGELELAEGDEVRPATLDAFADAPPRALPPIHPLTPVDVDPEAGQITAPLGAIERTAAGVRATAQLFGERSVLTAAFATTDPDEPLFIAARGDEPLVVSLGGREWELPER